MRFPLHIALLGVLLVGGLNETRAQAPDPAGSANPSQLGFLETVPGKSLAAPPAALDVQMAALTRTEAELQAQQAAAQGTTAQDQKKQIEILQKQIETQQQMIELLMKRVKDLQVGGAPVQRLEVQMATLEARGRQAAQRDQELAGTVDTMAEHQDSVERYGPALPAQLKELFLPSGNNETALSIYGAFAVGYSKFDGDSVNVQPAPRPSTPGGFYFGEFTPDFLLKLNDWIFLQAEISAGSSGAVSLGSFAEADFLVSDWLTISAGRIVAPIGWYNLRSNNPWVTKTPTDAPGSQPLLWMQVLPLLSLLGVEAKGSFYLGCSPFKLEYSAYISNGLNVTPATAGSPTINELANLENMENTLTFITNDKMIGGRVGLWWPECGLETAVSALYNGDYVAGGSEDSISLWAVDLHYHKGNWDGLLEYGMTYQHAQSFVADNIRREGVNFQVSYRPRDCANRYLQKLEVVYRYGYVDFHGIDATTLDLTTFATPVDVPVRRQQNEIGLDYWFYPRLVLKCFYQINDEFGFHLHDNQFISELAWGW
jgi:hypothetical protein